MKLLLVGAWVVLLAGCSGKIYTVQTPQFVDGKTEGVLFYGYKAVEKKTVLDRIRHTKTGNITHSMYETPGTAKYCSPQIKLKTVMVADYSTQYAIKYEPGLFETNKFSVELDKGMLKSVNSESTPGLKTAVESLQGLVDISQDILSGFVNAAEVDSAKAMNSVLGNAPQSTPIKCSTNQ